MVAEMSASRARRPNFRITDNLLCRLPSGDYELVLPKWRILSALPADQKTPPQSTGQAGPEFRSLYRS